MEIKEKPEEHQEAQVLAISAEKNSQEVLFQNDVFVQ